MRGYSPIRDESMFESLEYLESCDMSILAGTGTMGITRKGTVRIPIEGNQRGPSVAVHNVYFNPNFHTNIISGKL